MLRNILFLCFLAVTVAGQHYDQDKLPPPFITPTPALQPQHVSSGIYLGLSGRSNAKLCTNSRRKSHQFSANWPYWVPTYRSRAVYPHNHKVIRDASPTQLTPQFIKEYPVYVQEETNNVPEKNIFNDDFHKHNFGVNKNKLNQDQLLRTVYLESQEDPKSVPDHYISPIQVDAVRGNAASGPPVLSKSHLEDPPEPSVLCRRSGHDEDHAPSVEDDTRIGNNEQGSDEVQKALKLISNCVQNAKKVVAHESHLRRSMSESVNDNSDDLIQSNLMPADKVDAPVKTHKLRNRKLNSDELEVKLQHPAKGAHIANLADSNVMLIENGRVCYACSTANDPTCQHPDKTTTVKYCKKADNACVTKVFKTKSESVLTRDCGSTCNENDIPGVSPKYKSCKICHNDMCNEATAVTGLSMLAVTFIAMVISKQV